MNENDSRIEKEIEEANDEFMAMLGRWRDRSADPLMVCAVFLTHMVALAGHTMESDEEYERFLSEVIKRGKERYARDRDNPTFVN